MGDDNQSLLANIEDMNKKEWVNNLYINASFMSKFFGCWAGTYSKWVNKNKGLYDSTDTAFVERTNKTEVLTNYINDQAYKLYGDFRSEEESEGEIKFNTFKLLASAFK